MTLPYLPFILSLFFGSILRFYVREGLLFIYFLNGVGYIFSYYAYWLKSCTITPVWFTDKRENVQHITMISNQKSL